jgi:SAM-dependent methyltransferase
MGPDVANGSRPCPLCEGTHTRVLFRSANGYPILRCLDCALAFTDDRRAPPPSELYPPFDQSDTASLQQVRSALNVFLRQREAVVRAIVPGGRLLDFGCGSGAFARWMSGAGYEVVGLEPWSLGTPERFERLTLLRQPLESATAALGTFDVITLWHVLEHLPRPVEALRRLVTHLRPGGALVVSVPNFRSWQSTLFRGRWFHLDPPRHLLHFEPATLDDCLARAGLVVVARRRFLPEYGTSGWVQSALNTLLPHPNYLYELVKDRGALAGMTPLARALHLTGSLVAGAPVLALSLPLEAAASAADRGAALTVAARRTR